MNMYCLESVGAQDGSWAESVDLTRFVAADNELEIIADDVFPDVDPREIADEEDGKGNQFGGKQSLTLPTSQSFPETYRHPVSSYFWA